MVDAVTAMPALVMANNADFVRTVLLTVDALPYDLTNHIIEMEVRARPEAAETFISIDNDELGGIWIEDPPTDGQFTFKLPLDRLLRMGARDYYYDVVLTRPGDGFKINLGINTITIAQGITRYA